MAKSLTINGPTDSTASKPKPKVSKPKSRENGKLGGRPKKEVLLHEFETIGPPPIGKPLELARWVQSVLAVDMYRMINGTAKDELSTSLRNTGRAIVASLPPDIIAEAKRLMDADAGVLEGDAGPQTVDADGLEDYHDGQSKPTRSISG